MTQRGTRKLFGGDYLDDEVERRISSLRAALKKLNKAHFVDKQSATEATRGMLDDYLLEGPIRIHWEAPETVGEPQEIEEPTTGIFGDTVTVHKIEYHLLVPVDGDATLLTYKAKALSPSSSLPGVPSAQGLEFFWSMKPQDDPNEMQEWLWAQQETIDGFLRHLNGVIESGNQRLSGVLAKAVADRIDREAKRQELAASTPFPIRRAAESKASPISVVPRRKLRVAQPEPGASQPEYAVEMAAFEDIVGDCEAVGRMLERMGDTDTLGEELLRNLYLAMLNTNYPGDVGGELFNAAGKTDITVKQGDRMLFIAECKFYKGPQSVTDAIDQLLGYTTWRDTKAALILFSRNAGFTDAAEKARKAVADHPQCRSEVSTRGLGRSDFLFNHPKDRGHQVRLALVTADLSSKRRPD